MSYVPITTIDGVIDALQKIIDDSIATNSRTGYFAALYYKVTAAVRDGIASGQFQNGPRMEKFDVLFANRYLEAYYNWKNNLPLTASWQYAFAETPKRGVLVLQHLLLGMNAHINLDLGIVAVQAAGSEPFADIQVDFNSINSIISALTYQVLNEISRVSPLLSLLGLHSGDSTSALIQFSIDNARDGAWCFAEDLLKTTGDAYQTTVTKRDQTIQTLAQSITTAKGLMRLTIWTIHLFEWKNPARITKTLHEFVKTKIVISS